jgi:hypothetical protein
MDHRRLRGGDNQKASAGYLIAKASRVGILRPYSGPPKVILKADDIVFAKVRSPLNLNENKGAVPDILNPVSDAGWNIDSSAFGELKVTAIERDSRHAGNRHPVFSPVFMFLVTQAFSRDYFDTFHLIGIPFVQNRKLAPGPSIELRRFIFCGHVQTLPQHLLDSQLPH